MGQVLEVVPVCQVTHRLVFVCLSWFTKILDDSLGLASYIYSLDGTTTYFYLPYATSEFDKHSLISTIQVAQAVVGMLIFSESMRLGLIGLLSVSVGKPVIAKLSDITTRGTSYSLVRTCRAILTMTKLILVQLVSGVLRDWWVLLGLICAVIVLTTVQVTL